jgi:DNA-binding response OmpR family regulator
MMVDDDEAFTEAVALALRQEGYEMAIESDTAAALKEMESRAPDLVILDVMFPEDDLAGLELARAMSKRRELSGIPILMLTGANPTLARNCTALASDAAGRPGAAFLDKSMGLDQLIGKVKSFLEATARQVNRPLHQNAVP